MKPQTKGNRLKQMLASKKQAVGLWLNFPSPDLAEFVGLAGFDFIVIDTEHYLFNPETITNTVRAVKAVDCTTLLRVRANDSSLILGYLDTGVEGIIVPHVSTAEEAKAVVDAVKYPPLGCRSANSMIRASDYGFNETHREFMRQANQETMVITMIEDEKAVGNLPNILAVEGLDTVFVGAEDLSASMGYTGQPGHPEVQALIQHVENLIFSSGKPLGRLGTTVEAAVLAFEAGAQFFILFFPAFLGQTFKTFLGEIQK